ncbi:hypothetical protein CDAR_126101 [Caerostris darwini]|uniref:Uncharacterized protein n=1 Tax=Caerostris darwini TaxID=1538125 RepID=A0AAV4SAK1_9ARAC|nr:hypothetical protein CDAR_126101 [Caerostris darwini]
MENKPKKKIKGEGHRPRSRGRDGWHPEIAGNTLRRIQSSRRRLSLSQFLKHALSVLAQQAHLAPLIAAGKQNKDDFSEARRDFQPFLFWEESVPKLKARCPSADRAEGARYGDRKTFPYVNGTSRGWGTEAQAMSPRSQRRFKHLITTFFSPAIYVAHVGYVGCESTVIIFLLGLAVGLNGGSQSGFAGSLSRCPPLQPLDAKMSRI